MHGSCRQFAIVGAVIAAAMGSVCPRLHAGEPSPEQIRQWVVELGDPLFAVRFKATERLAAAGAPAVRAVAVATVSDDLEVAHRARRILKTIALADVDSVPALLELQENAAADVARVVEGVLKLPRVQQQCELFVVRTRERAEDTLRLARGDLMAGRTATAWRRVQEVESLDKEYGLFEPPSPVLAVVGCLEVEATDERVSGKIEDRPAKARAALRQARVDVAAGRFEQGRRFVTAAERLGVSQDLGAGLQVLLAELDAADLLRAARADVAAGRTEAGRAKLLQIREADKKYGLFAKALNAETRARLVLFRSGDEKADLETLQAAPADLSRTLLESAKADLDAERLQAARRKASAARRLGIDERAKFFVKDIDDLLRDSVKRQTVADRLLEISGEFAAEGNTAQARNWLAHIVRVYPTTDAAEEAGRRLTSLP